MIEGQMVLFVIIELGKVDLKIIAGEMEPHLTSNFSFDLTSAPKMGNYMVSNYL